MKPTPKPSSKYARPPNPASYRSPMMKMPGGMNMPRRRNMAPVVPSMKKLVKIKPPSKR